MKFSAGEAGRKWPCGARSRDQWAMVTLAALFMPVVAALADTKIPLPQPRPAAAPALDGKQAGPGTPGSADALPEPPPAPSACRLALTDAVAIAPSIAPIKGPGACGGDDLVRLEAVVLPDRTRVPVKPAATLRCTMASAIADWIRIDMAPLAEGIGSRVSELDNFDSFECRGRNRVVGAKLSEHGKANALDVRGLRLANGQFIGLTDRTVARDVREKVMGSVCARFTTVLGPGSDGYHEDHIHLDLAERHNGYRICHWELYDPMPAIAPLLPAERPTEAPPRDTVADQPETSTPSAPPAITPQEKPAVADDNKPAPETASVPLPVPSPKARASGRAAKAAKEVSPRVATGDAKVARSTKPKSKTRPKRRRSDLPPFLRQLFN
jgi:hypothetical protein